MRLNIGSGMMPFRNCVNFDLKRYRGVNVIGDACDLPFKLGVFDRIFMVHTLEHFAYQDSLRILRNLFGLLKPDGTLYIEGPDIRKCYQCSNGDLALAQNLYGEPSLTPHKWGWTLKRLVEEMNKLGYRVTEYGDGKMHGRPERDFMVVGQKCTSA